MNNKVYPIVTCDSCGEEFEWTRGSYHLRVSEHKFCNNDCYYEWRKDIKNHPAWKGGQVEMQGYIFLKVEGHPYGNELGYVKRSRLMMEAHLGRYLEPEETIHHINGIRDDDRIENFKLYSCNSEHMKQHHRISKYPLINVYGKKEICRIFNVTSQSVYRWLENPDKTKWLQEQLENQDSKQLVLQGV